MRNIKVWGVWNEFGGQAWRVTKGGKTRWIHEGGWFNHPGEPAYWTTNYSQAEKQADCRYEVREMTETDLIQFPEIMRAVALLLDMCRADQELSDAKVAGWNCECAS